MVGDKVTFKIMVAAAIIFAITINPAITGHAEKVEANSAPIAQECMNISSPFNITKIIQILINIISYVICFILGYYIGQLLYDLLHNTANYR